MGKRIPATIITGFLGAGKTSLIRHTIENNQGRKLAFLINEFGSLGIDRELLSGCGVEGCGDGDIIELANGCICCTVADDFLPAMTSLLARDPLPDHILIETSGLALPKPLIEAFNWPAIRTGVTVDGVVAIVDGDALAAGRFAHDEEALEKQRQEDEELDHESPLEELFEEQLMAADLVVLNKMDLVPKAQQKTLLKALSQRLREGVKLLSVAHAMLPVSIFMGLEAEAERDLDNRPSHHDAGEPHEHDDFESFVMEWGATPDSAMLEEKLKILAEKHDILRMKGFLYRKGALRREVIQGVGQRFQRYFDRPFKEGEKCGSQLVIIGLHGMQETVIKKEIKEALSL